MSVTRAFTVNYDDTFGEFYVFEGNAHTGTLLGYFYKSASGVADGRTIGSMIGAFIEGLDDVSGSFPNPDVFDEFYRR